MTQPDRLSDGLPALTSDYEQTIEELMRENACMRAAISNLEPLRDINWHGKWRIHKALDALQPSNNVEGK